NEFLRNAGDDKIAGFSDSEKSEIQSFKAEARFLRALAYTHAMDLYGNVPFVQETDPVSAFFPQRIMRSDLFDFIEKELVAISDILPAPKQNQYGRVSRGASWALLAKNYLNAEIYTGKARYNDCVTYSKKVIDAGYTLESDYKKLFN